MGDAPSRLLGGSPTEVPERVRRGRPRRLAPGIPTVVHAHDDDVVPFERASGMPRRTTDPKCASRRWEGGHYGLIDPENPAFAEVLAAVDLLAS